MIRPRDRASATGLLPRMEARPWADGKTITYRYHPHTGKPINLGTDRVAALRQVLDMTDSASDQGTVGQMWRLYIDSPAWARLTESTHVDYRQSWKQLAKVFEDAHVASIRASDLARYLRIERESKPRANREMAVLSNLLTVALERGLIEANPCVAHGVRKNHETPRTRLVSQAELNAFVPWALLQGESAVVLVSMAQFAALAGCRRTEFLNLHWPQVDAEKVRTLRAKQKGQAVREEITLSEALQDVLERMRQREGYNHMGAVFRAPKTGNPYTERGFKSMWHKLKVKALAQGIVAENFTFHDLRAHYTTFYKAKFGNLPELHSNPATTAKVYERSKEVRRQSI